MNLLSMIPLVLATTGAGTTQQSAEEITLFRKFTPNQVLDYSVEGNLTVEQRGGDLQTFIPQDITQKYGFTLAVQKAKADGIVQALYSRPSVTQITEVAGEAPQTLTVPLKLKIQMDVSPVNDILDTLDLTPKDPKKDTLIRASSPMAVQATQTDGVAAGLLGQFVGEMYRLALFTGTLDASMDFAPKLPLEKVKVGDTWKRTVGFTPQKNKNDSKQAVQRLDYTFTYKGKIKNSAGKDILRISAAFSTKSDLAEYAAQLLGEKATTGILKKIPLELSATIDYDLDPVSHHTLRASARSQGKFEIYAGTTSVAALQTNLRGRTTLKLNKINSPKTK